MTRDEVVHIAQKVGFKDGTPMVDFLQRFADLVADHIKTEDMAYEAAYLEGYEIGYVEGQQDERKKVK